MRKRQTIRLKAKQACTLYLAQLIQHKQQFHHESKQTINIMAQVIDSGQSWLCNIPDGGVGETHITVTMIGEQGLNAVCTGAARAGQVIDDLQNAYAVTLPGSFSGLNATFRKR
jgi:hypothetical protein